MVEVLLAAMGVHLLVGLLFGAAFVSKGVQRVDPAAAGSGVGFRLVILPGVAMLWPLLALRWMRGAGPPDERTAHKDMAARGQS